MAEQSTSSTGVFTRGFLPGLVLGVVIGAVVGFLATEVIGKSAPKIVDGAGPAAGEMTPQDDRGTPPLSREEIQRLADEAAKAAQEGDAATTTPPPAEPPASETPATDPPESDG